MNAPTRYACADNDYLAGDALNVIKSRLIGSQRKVISLAINRDFDIRWIGELPICFDGTPAQCVAYAKGQGYLWIGDDAMLLGGRFEHPTEPLILYPV